MFKEDFSVFTNPKEFGDTATIGATPVNGIYEHQYVETTINSVPVAGEHPTFGCAVADLPAYTYGTVLTVDGVTYKIRNWQPDGTGWTILILEKQ